MATQTLPNTKNDLIIERVLRELQSKSTMLKWTTDYSAFAGKGAKSISIPNLTSYTAANRAFGVAGVDSVLTDAVETLDLDQNNQ